MTPSQLKSLLPELQAKKFAHSTDKELLAYLRIYYALYAMVRDNALSAEYGDPALYQHKLQVLCRTLHNRYNAATNYAQRIKLLDALYTMHYATCVENNAAQSEQYFAEAENLLREYNPAEADPDTTYHAVRLMLSQYYGCTTDAEGLDQAVRYLDHCTSQLTAEGRWPDITPSQALQRINLFSTYEAFYNDTRYAETLRKASSYYFSVHTTDDYERLYDAVRDAATITADSCHQLDTITDRLPDTPMAHAIRIENTCRKITEEIQSALIF